MKTINPYILLLSAAIVMSGCASQSPKPAASNKKLELQTIDHGPGRPKTYVYREVNQ
ncbi:MAG: hypothetical protein P4L99_06670 [Chthoniobacter sp.]|nr:hypothetical protein [Chthoniobacter sp.]